MLKKTETLIMIGWEYIRPYLTLPPSSPPPPVLHVTGGSLLSKPSKKLFQFQARLHKMFTPGMRRAPQKSTCHGKVHLCPPYTVFFVATLYGIASLDLALMIKHQFFQETTSRSNYQRLRTTTYLLI